MTQLLHTALEEALKQPDDVQDAIAAAILAHLNPASPRPVGLAAGQVQVPDSFFDPLPEDELALWSGEGEDEPA